LINPFAALAHLIPLMLQKSHGTSRYSSQEKQQAKNRTHTLEQNKKSQRTFFVATNVRVQMGVSYQVPTPDPAVSFRVMLASFMFPVCSFLLLSCPFSHFFPRCCPSLITPPGLWKLLCAAIWISFANSWLGFISAASIVRFYTQRIGP
jgi:hypothetical protein